MRLIVVHICFASEFLEPPMYGSRKSTQVCLQWQDYRTIFWRFSSQNGRRIPSHHIYRNWLRHLLGSTFLEPPKVWAKLNPAQALHESFVMWCYGRSMREFFKSWCESLATCTQFRQTSTKCIESDVFGIRAYFIPYTFCWQKTLVKQCSQFLLNPVFWRFKKLTRKQMSQPISLNVMWFAFCGGMVLCR